MRIFVPLTVLFSLACDGAPKDAASDTQAPAATDETSPDEDDSAPPDSAAPDSPADADQGPNDTADSADPAPVPSDTADSTMADTAVDTGTEDTGREDTGSEDTGTEDSGSTTPIPMDADGDGWTVSDGDCDDFDSSIHPVRDEVCDGIDNNCDGDIDEGVIPVWYLDLDGDGHGTESLSYEGCEPMEGYVLLSDDCDDDADMVYPDADEWCDGVDNNCDGVVDEDVTETFYLDEDDDGFGDLGFPIEACALPDGYSDNAGDCNDLETSFFPDADEICDGFDNDCDGDTDEDEATDGITFYRDADIDGFGDATSTTSACAQPEGYTADNQDCDDHDNDIHPDAVEQCDGEDNNCDGTIDEDDAVDAPTFFLDSDTDGFGDPDAPTSACSVPDGHADNSEDCNDLNPLIHPDADEVCDSEDNDCDGETDENEASDASTFYRDADADSYGDPTDTTKACTLPDGFADNDLDCDDHDNDIHPDALEQCDDEDNDCDGETDEDDAIDATTFFLDSDTDGFGDPAEATGACAKPDGYVDNSEDCNDLNPLIHPDADEVCDSEDNDCDGDTDEDDAIDTTTFFLDGDEDGYGDPLAFTVQCDAPTGHVTDSSDCDDTRPTTHPDADEYCNDVDDDCNGEIDDGVPVDSSTFYPDIDGDGYGDTSTSFIGCEGDGYGVATPGDCDDGDLFVSPSATEVCDGVDNDCDGETDEAGAVGTARYHLDSDGDGYGSPSVSIDSCFPPPGYVLDSTDCYDEDPGVYPGAIEIFDDGVDQDCDGSDAVSPTHTGSEPGWYHGNYGAGPEFDPSYQYNGSVACSTVCANFGLTHHGARFVCNLGGSGPTEGCHSGNDGMYGEENCGKMVRDWVETTENGNTEDCAGGNIMGCVTGSCTEYVTYHSIECQCK